MKILQCVFDFLVAIQTWLSQSGLIPFSAIIAILLFATRECLETRRKKKAKQNEIQALKKILARECELNLHLSHQIFEICSNFAPYEQNENQCPYTLRLTPTPSSKIRYEIIEGEDLISGGQLSDSHTSIFDKYMFDVVKADIEFYNKLEAAYEAAIELQHFRDSLLDIDDTGKWMGDRSMVLGFSGYALEEMEPINGALNTFYKFCTGNELSKGRMR